MLGFRLLSLDMKPYGGRNKPNWSGLGQGRGGFCRRGQGARVAPDRRKSGERRMDLGIRGKRALVTAASKGLGRGWAEALAAAGAVDILVTNAGGPPPGMWHDWGREDFIRAIDANMLTPIALMTALMPAMIDKGWCRVVNITSQSVKAPIPQLGLSNAARTGLTGYVAGTSRQVAQYGVTINNLLPGIHATDRAVALDGCVVAARGITLEQAQAERAATIPARRYGTAAEFGAACAFLCSQHAGFIVGQNILLDGGATNATI